MSTWLPLPLPPAAAVAACCCGQRGCAPAAPAAFKRLTSCRTPGLLQANTNAAGGSANRKRGGRADLTGRALALHRSATSADCWLFSSCVTQRRAAVSPAASSVVTQCATPVWVTLASGFALQGRMLCRAPGSDKPTGIPAPALPVPSLGAVQQVHNAVCAGGGASGGGAPD